MEKKTKDGNASFSQGYQGKIFFYQEGGKKYMIKTPIGRGLGKFVRLLMLRHESRVYDRLRGVKGVPACHGLIRNRYLVLEYIDAVPFKQSTITDYEGFFEKLLELIKTLHSIGIAHTDMKKKDNLLVRHNDTPCLVDFGVAVIRKPGFAPLNHYLYNIASTFDFNAWVKLKYNGKYETISQEDAKYFNRTLIEKYTRWVKKNIFKRLRRIFHKETRNTH